jgi:NCS1 family nucleobase:cation symporter-1
MGKFDLPTRHGMTAPFRSKEAFLDFVKAPQGNEGHGTVGDPRWSNKDLEPTPEEHRTWTWYNSSDRLQRELTN